MGEKWVEIIDKYLTEKSPAESTTTFAITETTTTETAATTQTTTTGTAATTQTKTTTDFVLIPWETTTTPAEGNTTFNVGDLVKLIHYVLDCPIAYEEDEIKRYDLNNDGGIDVFDVILMRGAVIGNVEKLLEKRKELGDDKFLDLSDACNIVIYPDEYYETTTTTTAPKKAIASEITELDTPDRTEENIIIDWENNSILS